MYDLGEVPSGKYEELKLVSEKRGMEFEYAFLLDALQAERDQGITIDTTQILLVILTPVIKNVSSTLVVKAWQM